MLPDTCYLQTDPLPAVSIEGRLAVVLQGIGRAHRKVLLDGAILTCSACASTARGLARLEPSFTVSSFGWRNETLTDCAA